MTSTMVRPLGGQQGQMDAQRIQDLQQLQREYRHMELNRRAYADESQQLLRKQQTNMEKLRQENDVLKTELAMEFRQFKKPVDSASSDRLAKLREQVEHYQVAIEAEKQAMDTVTEQTGLVKRKILHQRKTMGGVNAAKENEYMVQKQVRILENRLDKALSKFNEALAHNKTLRQEIDDLRRERVLFDTIYKKMERELGDRKKMMANVIEMLELGRQMETELQSTALGVSASGTPPFPPSGGSGPCRIIGGAGGPGATSSGRGRQGNLRGGRGDVGKRPGSAAESGVSNSGHHHSGLLCDAEDAKTKGRSGKSTGGTASTERAENQASLERIQNFEEAFARIRSATGIDDIEELVRTFVKNEDQNFSLFNYVNEQQNELEKLEDHLSHLQEEEKRFAQESGSDVHQHKQALKDLEAKLQNTESAAQKYETRCVEASRTIEALKDGVKSLLSHVFGNESLPETFNGETVTDSNIMVFLGMAEERTNQLLQAYAHTNEREKARVQATAALLSGGGTAGEGNAVGSEDDLALSKAGGAGSGTRAACAGGIVVSAVLGHGPQTPMRQELIHVNPPKLEDYSSSEDGGSDDDNARPLTREELKGRTLNKMQRKNARDGGGRGKGRLARAKY